MPCGEPHGGPEPSPERVVGERLCWDASPESLFGEGVGDADPCGDRGRTRSPRVRHHSVARAPWGGARRTTAAAGRVWAASVRVAANARASDDHAGQRPAGAPIDGEAGLVAAFSAESPGGRSEDRLHGQRHHRRHQRGESSTPRRCRRRYDSPFDLLPRSGPAPAPQARDGDGWTTCGRRATRQLTGLLSWDASAPPTGQVLRLVL
jgi:hypothetical protein